MTTTASSHASSPPRIGRRQYAAIVAGVIALAALILWSMGRVPVCRCGYVKPWHGIVQSAENSQHLTDWYTFSHIIHGFLFYGLFWLAGRRWPLGARLAAATLLEVSWEILENTDMVINRYREATIALDYYGDSILNSVSDVLAMVAGFLLASRLRIWIVVVLALTMELVVGCLIRDNLTLNILMLIHPMDWIKRWQGGG